MFTVEIVSLGHILQVPFPLFIEKGEEQHFLRGKPAFQAQIKIKRVVKSVDGTSLHTHTTTVIDLYTILHTIYIHYIYLHF